MINYWRQKAAFETKRRARPDYYRILNVSSLATEREIKTGMMMCLRAVANMSLKGPCLR